MIVYSLKLRLICLTSGFGSFPCESTWTVGYGYKLEAGDITMTTRLRLVFRTRQIKPRSNELSDIDSQYFPFPC
ncbi:hypothetical protein NIES2104_42700 [Leptolyngbya sp. NIES-2104]|nr:hypothetical protein NIES2104_42700 [Leptolyngbya sp. NIES-2104]